MVCCVLSLSVTCANDELFNWPPVVLKVDNAFHYFDKSPSSGYHIP